MSTANQVIPTDLAIKEIQDFVTKFDYKAKKDWEVKDDYPNMLQAVEEGLLSFDDKKKPTYKLRFPIKNDKKEIAIDTLNFRTRIRPQELSTVMRGLDISKNQIEYTLRCFAFLTGQPIAVIDKLEKFDYKVMEQVSTVFL